MLRWDMLGYGSSVGVGFAWFSWDQLRQLSFVSLWLGGVRCGAIRLGSYG